MTVVYDPERRVSPWSERDRPGLHVCTCPLCVCTCYACQRDLRPCAQQCALHAEHTLGCRRGGVVLLYDEVLA